MNVSFDAAHSKRHVIIEENELNRGYHLVALPSYDMMRASSLGTQREYYLPERSRSGIRSTGVHVHGAGRHKRITFDDLLWMNELRQSRYLCDCVSMYEFLDTFDVW